MFSPLASPAGMIVYDLTTSLPPLSHLVLSPFEIYREPLAIVAIADGDEIIQTSTMDIKRSSSGNMAQTGERQLRELDQELEALRDQYPKSLVHQLFIFDYVHPSTSPKLPEGLVAIPSPTESKFATIKTVMCDISSILLAEMTTLAKSFQGMSTIESPCQGQGIGFSNGHPWPVGQMDPLSWRNSRSQSPTGSRDRSHIRISRPAQHRPGHSESNSSSRPATPLDGSQFTPPNVTRSPENESISRVNATERFREQSRDRISVQGFGSNSLNKQSRNRGRVTIIVGSLYLQAGRWGDALRELVDGATIAQSSNDHLWHAKALENVVVAMLMLGWTGQDFKIPQICYLALDKSPYDNPPNTMLAQLKISSTTQIALLNLATLMPELLEKILSKYQRVTGETLPQLPLSEIIIRFSKLLASLHLSGGRLNEEMLRSVVLGIPFSKPVNVEIPRLNIHPTRSAIVAVLFRAFPLSSADDELSDLDKIIILGGIASVLGFLGYYRKKAMVMRELVSVLIPNLIQARKIGAAEIGIHPAAGLAALNAASSSTSGTGAFGLGDGDIETGVDGLLGLMAGTYGVVNFQSSPMNSSKLEEKAFDDSDEAAVARIISNSALRAFGGRNLKINVLRACIHLAEAFPDFQGILRFSTDLLRTVGSGIAPGPRGEDVSPSMMREEQVRLATNITRIIGAARKLGFHGVEAEYWDEFLVRGVDLEAQPLSRVPIPHQRNELGGTTDIAESTERNPFIYNPFLVQPDPATSERLLVAEESARFKIALQNPYEFELEIESVKLVSMGIDFESEVQHTVIGPYRTQIITISGTPKAVGSLIVKGCLIKVRGCRERRFPIFTDSWMPQYDAKVKVIGLAAMRSLRKRPLSTSSITTRPSVDQVAPKVSSLNINVIHEQPVIIVQSTSLSQSAIMILEGERQRFSVTLQNISNSTPADLLLFSFQDSTQAPLQTALSNKDVSPAELYEYELILSRKQALRWLKRENDVLHINPGGTATFEFEILGKAGLTSAAVQVDYGYLGVPISEVEEQFYTRQVTLPLTVTVNASVELARMDILPLAGSIPKNLFPDGHVEQTKKQIHAEDYFLLLLDLRNAWPSYLQINLEIVTGQSIEKCILPGNTVRIVFPVQRIYIENPYAAIPTLDPTRQRQFVVSTTKMSADSERTIRETFWYREEILKVFIGTWKTMSGQTRGGDVEFRGIRLSPRMVEVVKIEDIEIDLFIDNGSPSSMGEPNYQVELDSFINVRARITNRTSQPLHPMLRLQCSTRHQAANLSLDLSKKIVWDGTLQHTLLPLAANRSVETTVGFTVLCRGEFEINASVEDARLWKNEADEGEASGRSRANTMALMDTLLGAKERRIWYTRQPCRLIVRDSESSG